MVWCSVMWCDMLLIRWVGMRGEGRGYDMLLSYDNALLHSVLYCTVQYSTVQYSTVQYSTVQYSTVQGCINSSIKYFPM